MLCSTTLDLQYYVYLEIVLGVEEVFQNVLYSFLSNECFSYQLGQANLDVSARSASTWAEAESCII